MRAVAAEQGGFDPAGQAQHHPTMLLLEPRGGVDTGDAGGELTVEVETLTRPQVSGWVTGVSVVYRPGLRYE